MSKQKGTRGEKKVVDWFVKNGWFAQRTGGSGAGTNDDRSDVIAMRPNRFGRSDVAVIEVKARDDGTVRFHKDEIEQLKGVANSSGGLALFVTKPDLRSHDHMYAFYADELKENQVSYSITKDMLGSEHSLERKLDMYFDS